VNPTYVASLVFAVGPEGIDTPIPSPANNDKIQKELDLENILKVNVQRIEVLKRRIDAVHFESLETTTADHICLLKVDAIGVNTN
jgi:hypothetical protein